MTYDSGGGRIIGCRDFGKSSGIEGKIKTWQAADKIQLWISRLPNSCANLGRAEPTETIFDMV
jgi:hypothetical protein